MRSITFIVFLVLLIMPCFALPDSVITGPYSISFDLGLSESAYKTTTEIPKETESLGGEKYNVYNTKIEEKLETSAIPRFVSIEITQYESEIQLSPEEMLEVLRQKNPEWTKRKIDGSEGAIFKAQLETTEKGQTSTAELFYARFYLNADPKHSVCTIISTYPWDEGTLSLIKTIHVEKFTASDSDTMEHVASTTLPFKVLIDDKSEQMITTKEPLELAEGYVLQINHIDVNKSKVYLDLLKDNKVVDSKTISPSKDHASNEDKTYRFKKDIGNSTDIILIEVHFKNAFRGMDLDMGTVSSVMQISENPDNL